MRGREKICIHGGLLSQPVKTDGWLLLLTPWQLSALADVLMPAPATSSEAAHESSVLWSVLDEYAPRGRANRIDPIRLNPCRR